MMTMIQQRQMSLTPIDRETARMSDHAVIRRMSQRIDVGDAAALA